MKESNGKARNEKHSNGNEKCPGWAHQKKDIISLAFKKVSKNHLSGEAKNTKLKSKKQRRVFESCGYYQTV